jgi:hypothetical protein
VYSTVNRTFHFSYFGPDYPTSGSTVTGLARAYCNVIYLSVSFPSSIIR